MATKDENNGKAMGCVNANENSKAGQKNPHCGADLQIAGPSIATVDLVVTVTNNGPQTAENVVVTTAGNNGGNLLVSPLDGSWDGTLASGQSASFRIYDIPSYVTLATTTVSSDTNDPNPSNNVLLTTIDCGPLCAMG